MNTQFYHAVIKGLRESAALENYLSKHADDHVLETKTAHDVQLFAQMKEAGIADLAARAINSPAGKALAITAPVTAGGTYLLHRAGEEARETTRDLRNKALQTGLGLAGIGAGLYGLHRLTQPNTTQSINAQVDPQTGKMGPMYVQMQKRSSAREVPQQLIEKLATVGFLDTVLEAQEKHADENIRRDAHECRLLNAEHGIDILRQLLP
jgi:hypothetical protein